MIVTDWIGCIDKDVLLPAHERKVKENSDQQTRSKRHGANSTKLRSVGAQHAPKQVTITEFSRLRHIPLAALRLNRKHEGSRIEGVVCSKAVCTPAVHLLLEDVTDSCHAVVVKLPCPASAKRSSPPDVQRLFPEGARLAIKDPYYTLLSYGSSGIQVDNPADLLNLEGIDVAHCSATVASYEVTKAQGNQAFRSVLLIPFVCITCQIQVL